MPYKSNLLNIESNNRIPSRIAEELRRFPPFSMMDEGTVLSLAERASVQVAIKGETLWKQGEVPSNDLLFLARGRVEYYWHNEASSELVDIRDVGDLLGLTALVENVAYQVSAQSTEDCLLYTIPWENVAPVIDGLDEARNYVRRHLFWLTRVGGAVPRDANTQISKADGVAGRVKGILQAHLDNAQMLVSRTMSKLKTCHPNDSVLEAATRMSHQDLESIIVINEAQHPVGIVTAHDIVTHVVAGDADPRLAVESIMSNPVITIAQNSSAVAATLTMMRHKVSHICVTADGSTQSPVLDVWSDRELMTRSSQHPSGLLRELGRVKTITRTKELSDEIEGFAGHYLNAGVSPTLVGQICAELYDQMLQRLLTLAKNDWVERGDNLPDVPWAWMSVGSDGRREQLLRTDMDNALVFASTGHPETDEANRSTFLRFTTRVVEMLVDCGISRCQGGVMASNPKWCRTDKEWQEELSLQYFNPDPETILRSLVLFDLRYVAGDPSLVPPLRKIVFDTVPKNKVIMTKLAELVVKQPPPLNFLGRFVVEKKGGREVELDLKSRGLAPLRDAARLLVMKYGLNTHYSTGSRWEHLGKAIPELSELATLAHESHEELLRRRVLNGIKRQDSGRHLDTSNLTKLDRARLANIFSVLRMVQSQIKLEFHLDSRMR